ncbi:MAG: cytochrome c3 family protein [Myxococcales bacterium]|jgi:c(7)-type cytochrome triheme protein
MRPSKASILITSLLLLTVPLASMAMPDRVRIPVVRDHEGYPENPALFSHWSHESFKCYECHPRPFPQALKGFTHDDMDRGEYCASCHDGTRAFAVDDAECETCHVPNE